MTRGRLAPAAHQSSPPRRFSTPLSTSSPPLLLMIIHLLALVLAHGPRCLSCLGIRGLGAPPGIHQLNHGGTLLDDRKRLGGVKGDGQGSHKGNAGAVTRIYHNSCPLHSRATPYTIPHLPLPRPCTTLSTLNPLQT